MPMNDERDLDRAVAQIDLAREANFNLGALQVLPSSREVVSPNGRDTVEPRVMQVFVCLVRASGSVVSRDALIRHCWGGRVVGEDAINRCIAKVRQIANEIDPPPFTIETIPRIGYRLKADAPAIPDPVSAPPAIPPAGEMVPSAKAPVPGRHPSRRIWWVAASAISCAALVAAGTWLLWPSTERPATVTGVMSSWKPACSLISPLSRPGARVCRRKPLSSTPGFPRR